MRQTLVRFLVFTLTACADAASEREAIDPLVELREACAALARSWCTSAALCRSTRFASDYGTEDNCQNRRTVQCERSELGYGSLATAESIRTCAVASEDLESEDLSDRCRAFLSRERGRDPPDPCVALGTLPDGSACLDDGQCETGLCATAGVCGACASPRAKGELCFDDAECARGLVCAALRCAELGEKGAECGPDRPCLPHLACSAGACAERRDKGMPCDPAADECALWPAELVCSPTRKLCESYVVHGDGEPCGELEDGSGSIALCAYGLRCRADEDPRYGSCVPALSDGVICLTFALEPKHKRIYPYGGPCSEPAVCFEARCQIPDAAACSAGPPP